MQLSSQLAEVLATALQYWCRERLKKLEFLPMGANAGAPNNVEQQTAIVKATLEQLVEIQTPGKIVPLPFEYVAKV